MNVYVLRYQFSHHGESFTRSVHVTHKGALLEQCTYLLEVLLDMDWDDEDLKEMVFIENILKNDEPITVDELIQHVNVLERCAEYEEIYTEIEGLRLLP